MRIEIDGMHCDACVRRVRKALEAAGVAAREVKVGSAEVDAPPEREAAAIEAVRKAGFSPHKSA
jgi:copper chaperone